MARSSRWAQWVITESANPRIPLPWMIGDRVRLSQTPRNPLPR